MTTPIINLNYVTTDVYGSLFVHVKSIGEKVNIHEYNTKLLMSISDFYSFIRHPCTREHVYNINILKSSGLLIMAIDGEYFGLHIKGDATVTQSGFVCEKVTTDIKSGAISLHKEIFTINFGGELNGSQD